MLLPQHIVCIQYVILLFLFCQQRLLLRTIKETKCTLLTRKNCTLCRFYYGLSTHNENAKTGHSFCYALFFMAESKGFEPSNRFRRLHDFQSCSFDQLGQLSIDQMTRNIIYDFIQKSKQIFSYYSKFALSAHIRIKRSPMRLPSEPKTSIFLQS